MCDQDVDVIVVFIDQVDFFICQYNECFYVFECWCDQLIVGGDVVFDVFVGEFFECDCQYLCGLVCYVQYEVVYNKLLVVVCKVFKYICELDEIKCGLCQVLLCWCLGYVLGVGVVDGDCIDFQGWLVDVDWY